MKLWCWLSSLPGVVRRGYVRKRRPGLPGNRPGRPERATQNGAMQSFPFFLARKLQAFGVIFSLFFWKMMFAFFDTPGPPKMPKIKRI